MRQLYTQLSGGGGVQATEKKIQNKDPEIGECIEKNRTQGIEQSLMKNQRVQVRVEMFKSTLRV